jgi:hypothetical protein
MVPVECSLPPGAVIFPTGVTPRFHEFYDSLDLLLVPEGSARLRLGGPDCDTNRNRALRNLPEEAKWAFFLDDDQTFDNFILIKMLHTMYEFPNVDALTGWYTKKTPPFAPILFRDSTDAGAPEFERMMLTDVIEAKKNGPMLKISACGGGVLLVKRETLDAVQVDDLNGKPIWFVPGPGRQWGGDLGFGAAMKRKGLNLWADLSQPVGHCMATVITPVWDGDDLNFKFSFGDNSFSIPSKFFPEVRQQVGPR